MQSNEVLQSGSTEKVNGKPRFPDWTGRIVVLIATGPSLTAEQIEYVKKKRKRGKCRVIAINEAGVSTYKPLAAPWADMLYAADRAWWQHYKPEFYGYRVSGEPVEGVNTIPLKMLEREEPMSRDPSTVVSCGHSGFQALGLALALGATKIIMLGYDCGGPKRNAHDNRPEAFKRRVNMQAWAECYDRVPREFPDVEFANCAPYSAIRAFPKCELTEVL